MATHTDYTGMTIEEFHAARQAFDNNFDTSCDDLPPQSLVGPNACMDGPLSCLKEIAKLAPLASGKSMDPVVFMLDSLSAMENIKCLTRTK